MLGFHIDMNVGQFRKEYLEKWLRELAALGYDTIVWEVENNVQWQSCPECVSPDAFTKDEFQSLLRLCAELGLQSIPLFQTLGHCEYVLKHPAYKHLAELPNHIDQYCPLHPQLPDFLTAWIDEYRELFGEVSKFHIGADEGRLLGSCPRCRDYVNKHSHSELYIQHINRICKHLLQHGIQPILWADMVLSYPEAIDQLSRKIIFADWMYDIYRDNGKVWVWGEGLRTKDQLSRKTLEIYGDYLFPFGDEPGREPETFYTADFLAAQGFATVTCPGSSSYGDNVFTPRNYYHMKNTCDSVRKGMSAHLAGSLLTSWTIHLFPWELQRASICLGPFAAQKPPAGLSEYETRFLEDHFGVGDRDFFRACGLLSKSCLFSYNGSLGFDKSTRPAPADHVAKTIRKVIEESRHYQELRNALDRLAEYQKGLGLLENYMDKAVKGHEYLAFWKLAARNLINRAMASAYLLHQAIRTADGACSVSIDAVDPPYKILGQLRELRQETTLLYRAIIKPTRLNELMHWIYDSIEDTLQTIVPAKIS